MRKANHTVNKPGKRKGKTEESIGQITSLPDFYEDFRPEAINETFFTESAQIEQSIHHVNLWFFTRC
jgi:hypothetical protein